MAKSCLPTQPLRIEQVTGRDVISNFMQQICKSRGATCLGTLSKVRRPRPELTPGLLGHLECLYLVFHLRPILRYPFSW